MNARNDDDFGAAPRWCSWLVAVVCFGPLFATLMLGMLILPIWLVMLVELLAAPEKFAHDPSASIGVVLYPIFCVVCGAIGIVGLLRVLTLSRRERPRAHRFFTLAMVGIGLLGAAAFKWSVIVDLLRGAPEGVSVVPFVLLVVLPVAGAAWLLFSERKLLFAPGRSVRNRGAD